MAIFDEKIEIRERCKGVHCVDLGESFPTRIYLQKSASIQPRTSPSKFEGKFNSLFTSLLNGDAPTSPPRRLLQKMNALTTASWLFFEAAFAFTHVNSRLFDTFSK